jgi:hypothetical protein
MKSQFNVELPAGQIAHIRADRAMAKTTLSIIVSTAIDAWFSGFSPDRRRKFYANSKMKPYARSGNGKAKA